MAPITVCFLIGDLSRNGGTERVTALIANELSKDPDYRVVIASTHNATGSSFFPIASAVEQHSFFLKETISFKIHYLPLIVKLRRFLRRRQIDILIDVDIILDLFSLPAVAFTRTRLISWEHFHLYNNNGSRLRDLARRFAAAASDCIVTLTPTDKAHYQQTFKHLRRIESVFNPIASSACPPCDLQAHQILSVGRLSFQKGFDLLCEIAKTVLPQQPDWKWRIVGEGEDRAMLEGKIKAYGLEKQLVLEGATRSMEAYYQSSSIFALTSRYEGLPMVLLEAQSYRMPIVAFDCLTGPADMIRDGENGFLIPENDLSLYAEQLLTLMRELPLRKTFSDHSQKNRRSFEMQTVIRQWKAILSSLAAGRS